VRRLRQLAPVRALRVERRQAGQTRADRPAAQDRQDAVDEGDLAGVVDTGR
jgi:hypothetical protein